MKKQLSLILIFVLCLWMAGCGSEAQSPVSVRIEYDSAVVSYLALTDNSEFTFRHLGSFDVH